MSFNLSCPSCKSPVPFNANHCLQCGSKIVGGWDQSDARKLFVRGFLFTLLIAPFIGLISYLLDGDRILLFSLAEYYIKASWWQGTVLLPVMGGIMNVWVVTWYRRNRVIK